jgi:hypothetical protein
MKTTLMPLAKGDLSSLKSAQSRKILQHVLSPLEAAAFRNIYKPFDYEIEKGKSIYITHYTCKELLRSTAHKLDLLLNSTTRSIYFNRVPAKHRKAFDDVKIILSLYPVLRNKLCRLDCFTLLSIMKQGRKYFSEEQKFGKGEMQTIDRLFAKYNCSHLFKDL